MRTTTVLARLLLCACLLLGALPLTAEDEGMKCAAPKFEIKGWEDAQTLIISASVDPERRFDVDIGLTKVKKEMASGFMHRRTDGVKYDYLPPSSEPPHDNKASSEMESQGCPVISSSDPTSGSYEYVGCAKNLTIKKKGDDSASIVVHFAPSDFSRLLVKDGELHVHYKSVEGCEAEGWQQLTGYDRSVAKIEAGLAYVRNGAGDWDARGEAAVRLVTRWRLGLSGAVDIRYNGLAKSDTNTDNSPAEPDGSLAADSKDSQDTFDPFTASDGILRANFGLAYHLRYRGAIPSLAGSVVGGFGLSTLKGVTGSDSTFSDTQPRYFGGFRLTVPRYHVQGLDTITNPQGSIQFTFARDKIWGDRPNRFIVESFFEFTEIGSGGENNKGTPVSVRLFWDTPSNLRGPSDLRVSILVAANIFRH